MKSLKTFLSLSIITLLSILSISACGPRTLVMGTSADYPPYEFKDTTGAETEIVGFDIDLARAIASSLNVTLAIEDMNFDELIPALEKNRVDFVMAGLSPTPEREAKVDFTDIYYKASTIVLMPKSKRFQPPEELAGKRIGVQVSSTQADAAGKVPDIELVEFDKIGEIIQAVQGKTIDGAIIESTVARQYASANPDLDFSHPFDTGEEGSAIAFPKGSEYTQQFNRILQQLKQNGEIERLIQKWFD
ncbi:transporter substrate-binding domain-containing protein [Roseofilum casamattae]|uniref:Transporter substrate-binding domain-containing protein n=1 Tax=Roseofilum casamattae BLCC-M143 TaxID=3022442 RepID=A0ABT7BYY4_9CYAN|nr:transporter substrate-binding domain-containing protein [Roseofilum casamattae]MDJ1184407.1 transporter substrate-binding domain-containing protein [Roseofilum casamattae BLCC-M143]